MLFRSLSVSLVFSAFFVATSPFLFAMNDLEARGYRFTNDEISAPQKLTLKERFDLIDGKKNPVLKTNEDFDTLSLLLDSPIKYKMSYFIYAAYKKGDYSRTEEDSPNYKISIALLENGLKVFIKESESKENAIMEGTIPSISRDFFSKPVIPPAYLEQISKDVIHIRQFLIENDDEILDQDEYMKSPWKIITKKPEIYGHSKGFINDLTVFEDFILATDRNASNYLWGHPNKANELQEPFFFAIDFALSYYDFDRQGVDYLPRLSLSPLISQNSIAKLETIAINFETYFETAKKLDPAHYTSNYFQTMRTWQNVLLDRQRKYLPSPKLGNVINGYLHAIFNKNKRPI